MHCKCARARLCSFTVHSVSCCSLPATSPRCAVSVCALPASCSLFCTPCTSASWRLLRHAAFSPFCPTHLPCLSIVVQAVASLCRQPPGPNRPAAQRLPGTQCGAVGVWGCHCGHHTTHTCDPGVSGMLIVCKHDRHHACTRRIDLSSVSLSVFVSLHTIWAAHAQYMCLPHLLKCARRMRHSHTRTSVWHAHFT